MRKYFEVFKFNLKTKINFKAEYIFSLFSFTIHVFVFNELWDFILKDKIILGYSREDLIWYIIMGEFLYYILGSKSYKEISNMIKNGDVANMLTKPISFLKYIIAIEFTCIINVIINFIFAIILGIILAGTLNISISNLLLFSISIILAIILLILIQVMIGMLAFLTEENEAYRLVVFKAILLLILTPLEFFPSFVKSFLSFLPTTYAIYPVGKILVHFEMKNSLILIGCQIISVIVMLGIVNILNIKGVRNINVNGG